MIIQVEVQEAIKYFHTEDQRTMGASCVHNYIVWKHQKTHESLRSLEISSIVPIFKRIVFLKQILDNTKKRIFD